MLMSSDRAGWAFGQSLDWHLERGTRPAGVPAAKGAPWTNKEFANAVGKAKNAAQAPSERTIRNWRHGETLPEPADFNAVLAALFGGKSDYVDWRAELTNKYHEARAARDGGAEEPPARTQIATLTPAVSVPTPPLRCLGRDEDLTAVIQALMASGNRIAVLVLGGPGMGKTTLTRQAATDTAVIERFGNRRWFVELETAPDLKTTETVVVNALGLDPAAAKFEDALAALDRAPGLLVLDNLETPWDGARDDIEALLGRLHRRPNLILLASIRGYEPPAGLRWTRQRTMHPLEWPHDRDLFLDIAQKIKRDDPALEPLLKELAGIPLAIELIAQQAAAHDAVSAILDEWRRVGSALAKRRQVEPSRLTSLEISLELSFNSQRLGDAGRRLFSILGQLPAGIGAEDLSALLGDSAFDAQHGLLSCGLAFERSGRFDLLPPVRDHARRLHPPTDSDASLWQDHFLGLAQEHGDRIGTAAGTGSMSRLATELPNLDAAQRAAILNGDLKATLAGLFGISLVMRFTGLGSLTTIRELATACRAAGNAGGEANCIKSLGDIALARSDHEAAHKAYEQALPLYRRVGQILGEANCIQRLGDIALERSDHEAARQAYEQALPLYRQVDAIIGEADCIMSLGDVALERSDREAARQAYERALPLYRQVGQILGEANCIQSLGDIALARFDHEAARKAYEQALPLYRQVGQILGEANCIRSLGDIALALSDHEAVRNNYFDALRLYERIAEPYSIGRVHRDLAAMTKGNAREDHLAAARAAWTSIDRADLVATLK